MKNTEIIIPNTVTPLKAHRLINKVVKIDDGHLNIIVGEHVVTLTSGQEVEIPKGTPFAYANLSPSTTLITEITDLETIGDDTGTYADSTGNSYIENACPSIQISLSLYQSVADMLIHKDLFNAA